MFMKQTLHWMSFYHGPGDPLESRSKSRECEAYLLAVLRHYSLCWTEKLPFCWFSFIWTDDPTVQAVDVCFKRQKGWRAGLLLSETGTYKSITDVTTHTQPNPQAALTSCLRDGNRALGHLVKKQLSYPHCDSKSFNKKPTLVPREGGPTFPVTLRLRKKIHSLFFSPKLQRTTCGQNTARAQQMNSIAVWGD